MRKLLLIANLSTLIIGFFLIFSTRVLADDLTNTTLRLTRSKANTPTGGMVCAKTPSSISAAVAKVSVVFPVGFSVNPTASNWTVNTSSLPSGATAWPGINTASSVSGKTVVFPSNNLSANTFYCFNFSDTNTLTTGNSGADQFGSISTLTSANSTIDNAAYGVSIVNNDQVNVSATVPANSSDFNTQIKSDTLGKVGPNTSITYSIHYGSNLSNPANIQVQAEWSLGTISGQGTPSVDILDFVPLSATDAYGSAQPVVDTINRTITWTINNFPGHTTDQEVIFKLKTNYAYTGALPVAFNVAARIIGPGITTADSTVNQTFQNSVFESGGGGGGGGSGSSGGGSGSSSNSNSSGSAPVPTQAGTTFLNIQVATISSDNATVNVATNNKTTAKISYGTSPNNLSENAADNSNYYTHTFKLTKLSPNQTYYIKISATDSGGNTITSNIYTFKTAFPASPPEIDLGTVIIISENNIIINNAAAQKPQVPYIILPQNTSYQVSFSLKDNSAIKRLKMVVRNSKVLASETPNKNNEINTEVFESQPGAYIAHLLGQPQPGIYDALIDLFDKFGNVAEEKIATIKITNPFTVLSKKNLPIEGASSVLYIYDRESKTYVKISGTPTLPTPSYTDSHGIINYVLPQGTYKTEIKAIGYKSKTVIFTINKNSPDYPTIYLESEPFNLVTIFLYYGDTIGFVYSNSVGLVATLANSIRFFDLVVFLSFAFLAFTTIFAFCVRTHMRLEHLPIFFLYNLEDLLRISSDRYLNGEVKDINSGQAVSRAEILIFDAKSNRLLSQTSSNKLGEFYLKKPKADLYKVIVSKDGFNKLISDKYDPNALVGKQEFILQKSNEPIKPVFTRQLIGGFENIFSFVFELLLFCCVFFEAIFIQIRGPVKTLPYIGITIFTIILWLLYARRGLRKTQNAQY